jgi:uncharacterized protein (DUF2235 family)
MATELRERPQREDDAVNHDSNACPIIQARVKKRIALFSDGTGNSSAKAQKTNVWRLFQALDQTNSGQIAKYDDGVGSSSNRYLAALGGAFGLGLKRNVLDLYKFVCRNYRAGDDIYCFGFSRGAFTIRVLVGLVAREGLVVYRSQKELDRNAAAAYRNFRYDAFPSKSPIVWFCRKVRDLILCVGNLIRGHGGYGQIAASTTAADRHVIPIRFLGLWDTVEAYGMPIAELKRAINWALWPMLFGDMKLTPRVTRAVHALSLDDERTTFHPLLWDEAWESELAHGDLVKKGRVTQVWFAGVHSNVGGGYPEDQLSFVPLEWIMGEAAKNELIFDSDQVEGISAAKSPLARLYDSRSGFAAYYRYSPRRTPKFSDGKTAILPNVHWSVLVRMAYGTDSYAPIILPHTFNVLTPAGQFLEIGELLRSVHAGTHETGEPQLDSAIECLETPDHNEVGLVWDTVFWRSCLYACTMVLTTFAVAFPWVSWLLPRSNIETAAAGPVSTLVEAFSALIPTYATRWKQSLTTYPLEFGLLLIGIGLTLAGSKTLEGRIHDRARLIWCRSTTESLAKYEKYRKWREENRNAFGRIMLAGAISLIAVFIAIIFLYGPARAGAYGLTAILLAMAYGVSLIAYRQKPNAAQSRIRNTLALRVARSIRQNRFLTWFYLKTNKYVIPTIFVILILWAGFVLANRAAFDVMSSAGLWCHGTVDSPKNGEEWHERLKSTVTERFGTEKMCWATGLVLEKDHRYIITLTTREGSGHRWFDRDIPTDPIGFPSDSLRYWSATPLRRWWNADWFKPIARIGRFGNDEYVLDPMNDLAPREKPPACLDKLHMQGGSITKKIDADLALRINVCSQVPDDRVTLQSEIKARSDGELFIYVNDAVLGIPGINDFFLRNNSGAATVTIERRTSHPVAVVQH